MNRHLAALPLFLLVAACSSSNASSEGDANPGAAGMGGQGVGGCTCGYDGGGSPAMSTATTSTRSRDTSPNVPAADAAALVDGNTSFALGVYQALGTESPGQNLFFSPYSMSIALAMTYAGAHGNTATQMASALDFTLPEAQLNPAFNALDLHLTNLGGAPAMTGAQPLTLHVVDALWGYTKETFQQSFLDTLALNYGAGITLVDFAGDPDGSRVAINDWVGMETNQKIQNLLAKGSITGLTRLVLVNAIYFDASWQTAFTPSATQPQTFTTLANTQVTVPMMHGGQIPASYGEGSGYQVVELPYQGDSVVMDIILPNQGTFTSFESTLTTPVLQSILGTLTPSLVNVGLPKFGYDGAGFSVKSVLAGLGMTDAFDEDKADFSGMSNDMLHVSDVIHKAFLSVDEAGTEAAAATAVIVGGTDGAVGPGPKVQSIFVDHSFFFALRDKTSGTILFVGRIGDPTAS